MLYRRIPSLSLALLLGLSATAVGLAAAPEADGVRHAVVLQYHHVSADTPPSTSVTPKQFRAHLDWLAEHDFHVMALPALLDTLEAGDTVPEHTVAITFDDAYRSVCETAWPLLRARRWPWTLFVNTDPLDQGQPSHCQWSELTALVDSGLVTVGNHSQRHDHLIRVTPLDAAWRQATRDDIKHAQQRIDTVLGKQPRLFAYPYGEYNRDLQALLTDLGYRALGQHSGVVAPWSPTTALPRFPASGPYARLESLTTKLQSRPLPVAKISAPDNPVLPAGNPPALVLSLVPDTPPLAVQCFTGDGTPIPTHQQHGRISARAEAPLGPGRHRYNCTAPGDNGRYYWFSHPWLIAPADGPWPAEPRE